VSLASPRRALLAGFLLASTAAPAWGRAGDQLLLPPGEQWDAWEQAWTEVATSAPDAMAGLQVALEVGASGWMLEVNDDRGAHRSVAVDPPTSHTDRLDLLYLALSLARPAEGSLSWSDLPGAWGLPPPPTEPEPAPGPVELSTTPVATPAPERPGRSFVSVDSAETATPTPEAPSAVDEASAAPHPTEPPGDSLEPPASDLYATLEPTHPQIDREPIPNLDDPDLVPPSWPSWAWIQGGLGGAWRPQTNPGLEGFLRAGWVTQRLRLGAGARLGTPTRLTAFARAAERSVWNLDLVGGPWVGLFPRVEAGLEAGAAMRWYYQSGSLATWRATPVVALELAGQTSPAPGTRLGLYLRGTVDTVDTWLYNGEACPTCPHELLWQWSLALGFHAGGRGRRIATTPE
jgi:hypothetical protein